VSKIEKMAEEGKRTKKLLTAKMEWAPSRRVDAASKGQLGE
jgi:hypothetical protein